MKLQDLVPPFELCKLIPEGEFADSYAAYFWDANGANITLDKRDGDAIWKDIVMAPAPTLQEIMYDLPQGVELSRDSEWFCSLDMTNEYYEKKPATAALKVWLKLKGIEA
ncbi:MAG: hypothetical protein IJW05_12110 [Lentisphaeria bacterium]|nr:hypothetical protein [Lentisphaeria bacterium]